MNCEPLHLVQLGEEFSQHTDDFHFRRGIALAHSRPVSREWWENRYDYFTANAFRALVGHDICTIGIVNEYRHREALPERKEGYLPTPEPKDDEPR